jgi:hypothetical protein
VYAAGAGAERGPTVRGPTVWKNGVALHLDDGKNGGHAQSVYVSGKDVYVCVPGFARGDESGENTVTVWKNGAVVQRIGLGHDCWSDSASVRVSGGDVYVMVNTSNTKMRALRVWKNGAELPGAEVLCVSGGDVYLAGHDAGDALTIWKNGKVKHRLPKGGPRANVMAIFVE